MGLTYRRTKRIGPLRLTAGRRGVSVGAHAGPVSVSSRGRGSVRLGRGLSYRFRLGGWLLALAVVGLLVVALAGCGGGATQSAPRPQSGLPSCGNEDASAGPVPCHWDAHVRGNHEGLSFDVLARDDLGHLSVHYVVEPGTEPGTVEGCAQAGAVIVANLVKDVQTRADLDRFDALKPLPAAECRGLSNAEHEAASDREDELLAPLTEEIGSRITLNGIGETP